VEIARARNFLAIPALRTAKKRRLGIVMGGGKKVWSRGSMGIRYESGDVIGEYLNRGREWRFGWVVRGRRAVM
jgi:hypothetical protein